ncbi:pullulanase-type alpha-1,6-glucosidase [Archangium sp.]|jgi:pullulanase-type alpha-1,6-glucosidase|uniref:pullulanase-type alpha-1,6-glucosidase n=1 Tax=Archangium sp. TaxID=1872627 RepID=UPI002ED7D0FB
MRTEAPPPTLLRARALLCALALLTAGTAAAEPTSVVLVGTVKDALNCLPDNTACAEARLAFEAEDNLWQAVLPLRKGTWTFRAAVEEAGSVSTYGQGGKVDGAAFSLTLAADSDVKFYFDSKSHWVSGNKSSVIATVAGSFQAALGCPGDWQPSCLRSWMQDPDGDGIYTFTANLPGGSYKYKVALDEGWTTSYGQNGGGGDITLDIPAGGATVKFYFDPKSHWVTSTKNANAVIATVAGSFQNELGCPPNPGESSDGDWRPSCLRSLMNDLDGDGLYTFTTTLPEGSYEYKVALDEGWATSYGKDGGGGNLSFDIPAGGAEIVFSFNPVTHVPSHSIVGVDVPRGNIRRVRAYWVSGDWLVWQPELPVPDGAVFSLHHDLSGAMTLEPSGIAGGSSITLERALLGLPPDVEARFPHLAGKLALRIPDASGIDVRQVLKGQLALSVKDAEGRLLDATSVQLPGVLDALYANDETLGVSWANGAPTLKLWAPTARNVSLHVFADSTSTTPVALVPMQLDQATGVWSHTGSADWKGRFYLYEVEVYVHAQKKVVKSLVTDPYSLSLSTNSTRSQLVDLADPALAPTDWASLVKPALDAPEDIVLYELHLRDFSINDATVPADKRGTFAAFTESGSNGMKHLRRLATHGLTHVHLLPVFDIATIDEDRSKHQPPAGDLSSMAPDSEAQQAAISAVRDLDGFNWGYDPYHYTVPEGSYAVNPDGSARILEFRQMVKALSDSGLRVVMDVVYNHTHAAGLADKSVLDKVVPGYYHRLNADGNVETSTCCANTASEHAMFEKLMVDSLVTWARAYKVDGFRFDLMGHHMKANLVKAQEKLRALTLEKDGVDGSKIYLYGEGWNFGEVENNKRGVNATQLNMPGTGIGTFSDRLRDAARGGGPFSGLQEQGFTSGLWYDPNGTDQGTSDNQREKLLHQADLIRVGLAGNLRDYALVNKAGETVKGSQVDYNGQPGGYTVDPQEVITYVSAHDNETLFDAIQLKAPASADLDARVRMHNMAMSLVALGQGIPFFHAGDELLRSKSMDRNSYNSGDWFNKLDFTYESNNWGVGLPPAGDNQEKWSVMKPLLANPDLKPGSAHITRALDHFEELLSIRKSAALLRPRTAEDVQAKVRFLNTGASQVPGLIVMNLRDEAAADGITDIVVLFNANDEAQAFPIPEYAGRGMKLHPVQADSSDTAVRTASFDASGAFTVPARTTAVFVNAQATPSEDDGCGGCAGTGGGAFGALAVLLGGVLRSRRRQRA